MVDDDVAECSNLPRQFLFSEIDIGESKAKVLCQRLQDRFFGDCFAKASRFSHKLMADLMLEYAPQVIVDAGDNLALSLQLDEAAKLSATFGTCFC